MGRPLIKKLYKKEVRLCSHAILSTHKEASLSIKKDLHIVLYNCNADSGTVHQSPKDMSSKSSLQFIINSYIDAADHLL